MRHAAARPVECKRVTGNVRETKELASANFARPVSRQCSDEGEEPQDEERTERRFLPAQRALRVTLSSRLVRNPAARFVHKYPSVERREDEANLEGPLSSERKGALPACFAK